MYEISIRIDWHLLQRFFIFVTKSILFRLERNRMRWSRKQEHYQYQIRIKSHTFTRSTVAFSSGHCFHSNRTLRAGLISKRMEKIPPESRVKEIIKMIRHIEKQYPINSSSSSSPTLIRIRFSEFAFFLFELVEFLLRFCSIKLRSKSIKLVAMFFSSIILDS